MTRKERTLPQMNGGLFITDGGLETSLIYQNGIDLPCFAAFDLLKNEAGYQTLKNYYAGYAGLAKKFNAGLILESPTWRANPDWGKILGYSHSELAEMNRKSIQLLKEIRDKFRDELPGMVISGCIGPRGDGYQPSAMMSADEAERYHSLQIKTFTECNVDMITGTTMNYAEESIGIVRAANTFNVPAAISFTVETDGRLPSGQKLDDAISLVDAATGGGPVYYMINCAHPEHFEHLFREHQPWLNRIRGLRANSSRKSHAELNQSTELDEGNPVELGMQYSQLVNRFRNINVLGGCCGTDYRHIGEIGKACLPLFQDTQLKLAG
jgi:S-methylmethionine-dependent homocysteine/selenocysteine methylase